MRDLLDSSRGYLNKSIRSRRVLCLSTGERRTSERQTLTDSTRNCANCWPSRPQTWHWPPSSHLMKLEVKGIIGWQRLESESRGYHRHRVALPRVFTLLTFFVERQTSATYTSARCRACCHMCSRISEKCDIEAASLQHPGSPSASCVSLRWPSHRHPVLLVCHVGTPSDHFLIDRTPSRDQ